MLAIVDTSALVETANIRSPMYAAVLAALGLPEFTLVIPTMVVAEASYLIGKHLGTAIEARFLASMAEVEVEPPLRQDWTRISQLVYQYRDFPLGGTDASVIALAERLDTDLIITLDRRHFAAVRPRHVPAFRILPE